MYLHPQFLLCFRLSFFRSWNQGEKNNRPVSHIAQMKKKLAINKLEQKSLMYYVPFEESVAFHFKKLESLSQGCFMLCLV